MTEVTPSLENSRFQAFFKITVLRSPAKRRALFLYSYLLSLLFSLLSFLSSLSHLDHQLLQIKNKSNSTRVNHFTTQKHAYTCIFSILARSHHKPDIARSTSNTYLADKRATVESPQNHHISVLRRYYICTFTKDRYYKVIIPSQLHPTLFSVQSIADRQTIIRINTDILGIAKLQQILILLNRFGTVL